MEDELGRKDEFHQTFKIKEIKFKEGIAIYARCILNFTNLCEKC